MLTVDKDGRIHDVDIRGPWLRDLDRVGLDDDRTSEGQDGGQAEEMFDHFHDLVTKDVALRGTRIWTS